MKNDLKPQKAKVVSIKNENVDSVCLKLKFDPLLQRNFEFAAGQFLMVGLPGFGEAPFTLSSNSKDSKKFFEICVRDVGELTHQINQLKNGGEIFVRGPFGNGFPEVKKNLILIGGGCGFVPLKSVLVENLNRQDIEIQVFVGCRNKQTLFFEKEYEKWSKKIDLNIILEESGCQGFSQKKGFVTELIKNQKLLDDPIVFICGPEVMYMFVVDELKKKKIKTENIFVSLERRMYCGVGVCQHCTCGDKSVCKDGPVFSCFEYERLKSKS